MRRIRLSWPAKAGSEALTALADAAEARHGVRVLRLKPGSLVEVLGPEGAAEAEVSAAEDRGGRPRLELRRLSPWRRPETVSGPRLALALIKASRFDWAVEKAVELGAAALVPLLCLRVKCGEAQPGEARRRRWEHLAEEARKQCGRAWPLEIWPPQSLEQLTTLPGPGFFLHPNGPSCPAVEAAASPLVAVGPEGGFSPEELRQLSEAGFQPWGLGPGLLRTETAALAALAKLLKVPA